MSCGEWFSNLYIKGDKAKEASEWLECNEEYNPWFCFDLSDEEKKEYYMSFRFPDRSFDSDSMLEEINKEFKEKFGITLQGYWTEDNDCDQYRCELNEEGEVVFFNLSIFERFPIDKLEYIYEKLCKEEEVEENGSSK